MISKNNGNRLIIALAAALALAACDKSTPPAPAPKPAQTAPTPPATPAVTPTPAPARATFVSVELGNGVNASGNALNGPASTTFGSKDTIYALVATSSASAEPSTIAARWTFGDSTLVNESNHQVSATGSSVTEFHISKPDGWPAGKYSVAVSIDGKPVGSKDFEVK
jgi:hypothetical protein